MPGSKIRIAINLPAIAPPEAIDSSEAISDGAAKGAQSGFMAGTEEGLEAAFVGCTILFFVCLPSFMVLGGTLGATFGSIEGSIKSVKTALPEEKAAALEALIKAYMETQDIPSNLKNTFNRQQNGRWQIVESNADITITLGLEQLRFIQFSDDELSIKLTSNLVVQYGPQTTDITKRILLNAESEQHHVDHWIADNGKNLAAGVNAVFEENSRQIVAILSQQLQPRSRRSLLTTYD